MAITLRNTKGSALTWTELDNNFTTLQTSISAIPSGPTGPTGPTGAAGPQGALLPALFGNATAAIGTGSYAPSAAGAVLTLAPGYAWLPAASAVVMRAASTALDFTGLGAGTYYLDVEATGAVSRQTAQGAGSLFSVAWSGSAFGAIERVAPVLWGAEDVLAAQHSEILGADFPGLAERLAAIEERLVSKAIGWPIFMPGKMLDAQLLFAVVPAFPMSIPAGLAGTTVRKTANPANSVTVTLKKNGAAFGTIVLAANGTVTLASAAGAAFNGSSDELSVEGPATADAMLTDLGIMLKGWR